MNKKDIEKLLKEEEMVSFISKLRTQFSVIMTEFYFFRTFFTALNTVGISGNTTKRSKFINDRIKTDHCIILHDKNDNYLETIYNLNKLSQDLNNYNSSFENTSMLESTHNLIDIFLSLFE